MSPSDTYFGDLDLPEVPNDVAKRLDERAKKIRTEGQGNPPALEDTSQDDFLLTQLAKESALNAGTLVEEHWSEAPHIVTEIDVRMWEFIENLTTGYRSEVKNVLDMYMLQHPTSMTSKMRRVIEHGNHLTPRFRIYDPQSGEQELLRLHNSYTESGLAVKGQLFEYQYEEDVDDFFNRNEVSPKNRLLILRLPPIIDTYHWKGNPQAEGYQLYESNNPSRVPLIMDQAIKWGWIYNKMMQSIYGSRDRSEHLGLSLDRVNANGVHLSGKDGFYYIWEVGLENSRREGN